MILSNHVRLSSRVAFYISQAAKAISLLSTPLLIIFAKPLLVNIQLFVQLLVCLTENYSDILLI